MNQFALTEAQNDVREMVRDFAERRIVPNAAQYDRDHFFDRALYNELGELGIMGVCVPEAFGGAGLDFVSYIAALEELSRADAGVGVTVAVHTSAATLPILHWGTETQKSEYVPRLASGEIIGAFALTESGSGSDAGSLRTTAVEESVAGGGATFRITGSKQWITNGSHAGVFLTFARSELETTNASGVTAFLIPGDRAGVSVVREEEKLGLNSSSTADIVFDSVEASHDEILGTRAKGFRIAMHTLDGGRIGIAAQAVGIAQAAYDCAVQYAATRLQFGKSIAEFQGVQFKLAEMSTAIEAARALTYRAAARKDAGLPHTLEGAQAKLFASRVAREQTSEAIQVLGGYGYTKEYPAERYYRDAKVTEIYEGTSEIQKIVIARNLLGNIGA